MGYSLIKTSPQNAEIFLKIYISKIKIFTTINTSMKTPPKGDITLKSHTSKINIYSKINSINKEININPKEINIYITHE